MRALKESWSMAVLLAAAFLSIRLVVPAVALAADSGSDSSGEVTPPSSLPGGEPDPLFDDEFDDAFDLDLDAQPAGFPDPLERTNRGVLAFNNLADRYLLDPITMAYGFVFPRPVKVAIRRALENVDEPSTAVNDIVQLEWKDAMIASARFVVNSTVGVGGLFDPAARWGLQSHHSDFGQTLALAGTPSGPYLVLPLVGPNTVRGGVGYLVDLLTRPSFYATSYMLGPMSLVFYHGGAGLTTREAHLEELGALRESSIDFYAALRNAYYQNRTAQIWAGREDRRPEAAAEGSE
jgi:phospholipid-binding lipoprotein MlaA